MNEFNQSVADEDPDYNPISDFVNDQHSPNADQIIADLGEARPSINAIPTILDPTEVQSELKDELEHTVVDNEPSPAVADGISEETITSGNSATHSLGEQTTDGPHGGTEEDDISMEEKLESVKEMFSESSDSAVDENLTEESPDQTTQSAKVDQERESQLEATLDRMQRMIEASEQQKQVTGTKNEHDKSSLLYATGAAVSGAVVNLAHGIKNGAINVSDKYSDTFASKINDGVEFAKNKLSQVMPVSDFQSAVVDARVEKLSELKSSLFTSVNDLKTSEYMTQYQAYLVQGVDIETSLISEKLNKLSSQEDFQGPLSNITNIQKQLIGNIDKVSSLLKEDLDLGVNSIDSISKTLDTVSKTLESVNEHVDVQTIQNLTKSISELIGRLFPTSAQSPSM